MKDDITYAEKLHLSLIRERPGLFIGSSNLSYLEHYIHGFNSAVTLLGLNTSETQKHVILPAGLISFIVEKYLGKGNTAKSCFDLILEAERDEEKAFVRFFELLEEYLSVNDYEPLPHGGDWGVRLQELKSIMRTDK